MNNKYIIKNLAPWMMDELIAFSKIIQFEIIFLRSQDEFYNEGIKELGDNGVHLSFNPIGLNHFLKKVKIVILFIIQNLRKFRFDYNGVIGIKSIFWFLKLDINKFTPNSKIHAQFATQAAIVSLLIKKYYNSSPDYSFTFHAYDIYFNNKWFSYLINNCYKSFSISEFNINYVYEKFIKSNKIILSRLGVNHNLISKVSNRDHKKSDTFILGLVSWFVEKKGIIYLLAAIKVLKERADIKVKLQLAGDGPLKSVFFDFVKINKLENNVEFIGKINGESKNTFFENLDAFILPSISLKNDKDGIPVVLMEAIAYGLPIISTNVSGIPEICIDDYNGLLIEEKDIDKIVDAVNYLIDNEDKQSIYSANSLKLSKEYDIDENSKNKLNILNWQQFIN